MKKYITRTELAAALGKSENTVAKWQKKGCPHRLHVGKNKGLAVRPVFNLREVKAWLLDSYLNGAKKAEQVNNAQKH